jgi:crotonobetainyl-CoA:carnitine CoA-transferase CaiB-like acyl-CoA transferase
MTAPLEGITVIDCATLFAGPLAATILGDFGADVIKVEHPNGDPARKFGWQKDGESYWWSLAGRNKRCVTLNLSKPRAVELLLNLVESADVLVENFRPGTFERWGLAPEVLQERNPGLVILRTTGFGQEGPYSGRPGFGTIAEAMSGFAHINGYPDGPPTLPPVALADGIAAIAGSSAVLSALWWREHGGNGKGQVIDLAIYEPLLWVLGPQVAVYEGLGIVQGRSGNRTPFTAPRNTYLTSDGRWLALSASTQQVAERVMTAIGCGAMVAEPWFADTLGRLEHVDEIDGAIGSWIGTRTEAEVLEAFAAADGAIGSVYSAADIAVDPHIQFRGSMVKVLDPEMGEIPMPGPLAVLSESAGTVRFPGRRLGADTAEVFKTIGVTDADLEELRQEGVV